MVPFYNVFGMTRSFIENEPGPPALEQALYH